MHYLCALAAGAGGYSGALRSRLRYIPNSSSTTWVELRYVRVPATVGPLRLRAGTQLSASWSH
jgi:hypothetical protein